MLVRKALGVRLHALYGGCGVWVSVAHAGLCNSVVRATLALCEVHKYTSWSAWPWVECGSHGYGVFNLNLFD